MESLDTFVPQVQGLSSTKYDLERLYQILTKSEDFLSKQTARLPPVLAALDPATHSLGYLFALWASLSLAHSFCFLSPWFLPPIIWCSPICLHVCCCIPIISYVVPALCSRFRSSVGEGRDALLSSANAANQVDILGTVSSFITCCSTEQIRLAPEKCESVQFCRL